MGFVARRDFKKDAPGQQLRKSYAFERRNADDTSKPLILCISTENPDRMGDTIALGGWDTKDYDNNPIVLFGHNSGAPPVGKSNRLWVESAMLLSSPVFVPREMYPFGAMIGDMVRGAWLNCSSVGFDPVEWKFNEERPGTWGAGIDFLKQTLLEYSIVPIPANADALVQARSAGVDTEPYREWLDETIELAKGPGFWVSAETLKELWPAVRKQRTISIPRPAEVTSLKLVDASGQEVAPSEEIRAALTKLAAARAKAAETSPDSEADAATLECVQRIETAMTVLQADVTAVRALAEAMSAEDAEEDAVTPPPKGAPAAVTREQLNQLLADSTVELEKKLKTRLTGRLD